MIRLKNIRFKQITKRLYTTRTNEVGVQMINEDLRSYIFGKKNPPKEKDIEQAREHLKEHNLADKKVDYLKEITNIELPKLIGNEIDYHFSRTAIRQTKNYFESLCQFANIGKLPDLPTKFDFSPGWTKYSSDGKISKVDYPTDKALVFDVETLVQDEMRPVIATAASSDAWYSWCSEALFTKDYTKNSKLTLDDLIPFESPNIDERKAIKRVVIGHNVGFDRSFIREQYFLEKSALRFLDTMSLHIACTGFSSEQRSGLLNENETIKNNNYNMKRKTSHEWKNEGSLNNLRDIHKFYCRDLKEITKETRNIFVKGSLKDVQEEFQLLMNYCANDVRATYEVFIELLNRYLDRFPHPITLAGMLEMSTMYLPTNRNWLKYINNCKNAYDDSQYLLKNLLEKSANEACEFINHKEKDSWLFNLDWSLKQIKFNKKPIDPKIDYVAKTLNIPDETNTIFKLLNQDDKYNVNTIKNRLNLNDITNEIFKTTKQLPKINQHLCNYPNWYRDLCLPVDHKDWKPGPCLITTKLRLTPNLLRLKWNDKPLIYENSAWFYFDSYKPEDSIELPESNSKKKKKALKDILIKKIDFNGSKVYKLHKIPHKDGEDLNVGNPLSKSFLTKVKEGTLSSFPKQSAELALKLYSIISYWENNEKRITSQKVIKISGDKKSKMVAAILPQTIVAGTITRRAVESTWLTASNYKKDRIGGELKTMIQCPDGYVFVGADVDSQELWIASTIGDSSFTKIHGSTAVSWMNLQGKKSDGTDIHSKTASIIGISRDQAKVFNYGRIYGAGKKFAEKLLLQFNPSMTPQEAAKKANLMYESTKGKRKTVEQLINDDQQKDTKNDSRRENNIVKVKKWMGGTESEMFNKLEEIAKSKVPQTPVLNASITKCLEPHLVEDDFMTSRINWVVQSSAVDYLHIMLVCMNWLIEKYKIDARFSISIHDEIRYIVREEDKYRAALALQITNLMTRSLFAYKLGFDDLPMSIAFFSGVDIDKCLRKEPDLDFVCPSNPNGLQKGYGIPKGECLDIYKILEHTNGFLSKK